MTLSYKSSDIDHRTVSKYNLKIVMIGDCVLPLFVVSIQIIKLAVIFQPIAHRL